ncbi:MAG: hypothetical protein WBY53_15420 [Acidobacteriaceae bacterium]
MRSTVEVVSPKRSIHQKAKTENLTVADAVWVGTALLHEKYQARPHFSVAEIVRSVEENHLTSGTHKSIEQHVKIHCVANRKPQPNRSRMLFATREATDTADNFRRIFLEGDRYDPAREGSLTHPSPAKLPERYRYLLDKVPDLLKRWHRVHAIPIVDPLLALIGVAKGCWGGLSPDQYVASLREGWEDRQ